MSTIFLHFLSRCFSFFNLFPKNEDKLKSTKTASGSFFYLLQLLQEFFFKMCSRGTMLVSDSLDSVFGELDPGFGQENGSLISRSDFESLLVRLICFVVFLVIIYYLPFFYPLLQLTFFFFLSILFFFFSQHFTYLHGLFSIFLGIQMTLFALFSLFSFFLCYSNLSLLSFSIFLFKQQPQPARQPVNRNKSSNSKQNVFQIDEWRIKLAQSPDEFISIWYRTHGDLVEEWIRQARSAELCHLLRLRSCSCFCRKRLGF